MYIYSFFIHIYIYLFVYVCIYIYIFYVCKSIYIYIVFSSKLEKDDWKVPIFFPAPGISRPPEELGLEQPLPENQKMGSEFCLPGFVCVCVLET